MRSVLVVVVCLGTACGSPSKPPPAPPKPAADRAKAAPAVTAETFCDHLDQLVRKCERLAGARTDRATCVTDARSGLETDPRFAEIAGCVVKHDDCDGVLACVAAGQSDPTDSLRACDDTSQLSAEHAVGIPRAEWDARNGTGVTVFHDAKSTKAAPIEMCGVAEATQWLTTLRCDNGSQPIKGIEDAERERSGNVGPGGRCHSIIDRYIVPCPEKPYEIFIDAYVCAQPPG